MLEQTSEERLTQAIGLAESGQRADAALLFRQVLAVQPDELTALLWLGYTSPDQVESETVISRSYDLAPTNGDVLRAVEWYNTHFVEATPPETPPVSAESEAERHKMLHTRVGEPVSDSENFFMSQTGGMVVASTIVLLGSIVTVLNYGVLNIVRWRPFGFVPAFGYAVIGVLVALMAVFFLYLAIRDAITAPVKSHGFITDRREVRQDIKTRYGSMTDYSYELKFLSDEAKERGEFPVKLTLTKEQYEASGRSNRAYVVYSKRIGSVRLYQALRSVY